MTMEKSPKKQKLRNAEYYDFQNVLDTLYSDSKNGKIFINLMELITSKENIELAYRNIKKNKGSRTAGVDKKTIAYIQKFNDDNLINYVRKRFSWYVPQPIRRVEIPKDNGKMRPLGIPTIMDRLLQQCILQVLEPICEAKFHERSNGFRPNRSTEHAIAQAYKFMQVSNLHYCVDIDIKGFFDNVSHGKLLKQIWTLGIRDRKLISIISTMLKAEVAEIGFPDKGTPQGGIISPLLSNVVLNELDWWIASQWEETKTRHPYVVLANRNGSDNKASKYNALKHTNLKECYIVRYADDFKIFCRYRKDALNLFFAVEKWLKERLGLDINTEKSKVINLKKQYSEFLGFKLKVHKKGKKSDSTPKYKVISHIKDKTIKKIHTEIKQYIKAIQYPANEKDEHKAVLNYNAYVLGIHNYYKIATHVNVDFRKIVFAVYRTMINRLKLRLKTKGKPLPKYFSERYGKSKQIRYVNGNALIPIGYISTIYPAFKKRIINSYTKEGRAEIHKNLECVNLEVMRYLMHNPLQNGTIEYNDNRLSLLCAQKGKCFVTGKPLEIGLIHCHHKTPIKSGGTDRYANLVLVNNDIHRLIHATRQETINEYTTLFNLDKKQLEKINRLREMSGVELIK